MEKVMVAMSGGVDSSVTAAILNEKGYNVVGATMKIIPDYIENPENQEGSCCAIEDAKRVASKLDIPHYSFNIKKEFHKQVIDYFVSEYTQGRTPNPCVICNKKIKFSLLMRKAKEIDCDYIATGHYSRIVKNDEADRYFLYKAVDKEKDQSYMLYALTQNQLKNTLLPLGELNKSKVRDIARKYNLPNYDKPDSQEICFVPDDDYTEFLENHFSDLGDSGPIYYVDGTKIGEHQGLYNYTIGQRRGLGISLDHPVYVLEMDSESNSLFVGPREELGFAGLTAKNVNWIAFAEDPKNIEAEVKIRYNSDPVKAQINKSGRSKVKVEFAEMKNAVAPGQAVVFYDDELVLGGGIIEEAF